MLSHSVALCNNEWKLNTANKIRWNQSKKSISNDYWGRSSLKHPKSFDCYPPRAVSSTPKVLWILRKYSRVFRVLRRCSERLLRHIQLFRNLETKAAVLFPWLTRSTGEATLRTKRDRGKMIFLAIHAKVAERSWILIVQSDYWH